MNKLVCSLVAVAAATLCVSAAPRPNDEAKLARALAGYEQSGPPADCVNMRDIGDNRSAGENAIVFHGTTGGRLWVNRPGGGCPEIGAGRYLVFRTTIDRLCRGDIADVVDSSSRIPVGSCGMGDFIPYRRISRR